MYLPEALGCKASVTLFGRSWQNEGEAAAEEESVQQHEGYGDPGAASTTAAKIPIRELLHRSQKG